MKNLFNVILTSVTLTITCLVFACQSKPDAATQQREDTKSNKLLQGTWVNDLEGNVVFRFCGDSVYYDDSLSTPAAFHVAHDTLFIENHPLTAYPISKLSKSEMTIVNPEGDVITLSKSANGAVMGGFFKGEVNLNQGKKVKKDTVMTNHDKHYHAYTQVNPTTYKVYHQATNSDGIRVESVYYDNIVYIALYEGQRKIFGSNMTKQDFAALVPESYIEQAVLSEIKAEKVLHNGVRFVAILSIPDGYTNYRVNIDINDQGQKKMSL